MIIKSIKTRIFQSNEDLFKFIIEHIPKLQDGDILAVTSKIVSYAEGRCIFPYSESQRDEIIAKESSFVLRTKYTWLTIKDGTVMASAGVDESNADGRLLLLPVDSWKSAMMLRKKLMKHYQVKKLGILITDSRLLPLRAGVVGVALGYAGFKGVRDYRGTPDLFGRKLKLSRTDVADSLATAAVFLMGEGNESMPLAVIHDAPVQYTNNTNRKELFIDPAEDLYAPLFQSLPKSQKIG